MPTRPNILLIITDQQSATMMSCAGNTDLHTPAMDSLAAEGIRFDRAYCTNPVCIASRYSLMTGRLPSHINMISNRTADVPRPSDAERRQGLGWLLRDAGYDALYGGKVHLPHMSDADVGFDRYCNDERDLLADACADLLLNRPAAGRPFFLVASLINPHDICYMAIRDFARTEKELGLIARGGVEIETLDRALVRPAGLSDGAFFADHCPALPPDFEPQPDEPEAIDRMLHARPFRRSARDQWSPRRWREHRWAYARLTEIVDRQIARILDALRRSAHDRDTVVIFTSDHGDMDAARRMEHKSTLYDNACRIPLIVRPAGGTTARVDTAHVVSNGLDLLPTLCDYAGATVPAGLAGQSWRPLVEQGPRSAASARVVPVEAAVGRALVSHRWKYCRYDLTARPERLTDLAADPHELASSIPQPQHEPVLAEMRTAFTAAFGPTSRDPDAVLAALFDA